VRSKIAMKLTTVSAALTTSKGTKARHRSTQNPWRKSINHVERFRQSSRPKTRREVNGVKHSKRHHDCQNLNAASYFKLQHHAVQSKLERCQVPRP
jgi:hypothetical protein